MNSVQVICFLLYPFLNHIYIKEYFSEGRRKYRWFSCNVTATDMPRTTPREAATSPNCENKQKWMEQLNGYCSA